MTATKRKNINPRIERKITRISSVREVKQTFLIICEGVNTEPDYFNAFRLTSANVKALGQGMGTLALVHKALFSKQEQAINHAKTIMKQFDGNNPAQQESSTTVYRLVEELNNFL